jgi:negative regulator of flagellin synthesis FlgM
MLKFVSVPSIIRYARGDSPQPDKDNVVKIDDSIKKTANLPVGQSSQARSGNGAAKTGATASASAPASTSDNVHISSQLKVLAGQVAGAGVFDTNKVEEIKAAIADGRFQVDPEKVATGLLESVRDLIHTRKN